MGEMGGARQRLEAAVRDRLMGGAAVLDRDRAVALAPDDQRRHIAEQIEPVGSAYMLAVDVDHRTQRLQEGSPRTRLLQRPQRPRNRLEVDAFRAALGAQAPPG